MFERLKSAHLKQTYGKDKIALKNFDDDLRLTLLVHY